MKRRNLLLSLLGSLTLASRSRPLHAADAKVDVAAIKENWQTLLNPATELNLSPDPIEKTKDEWQKLLPAESFEVLFEEETEPPFSNALNTEKRAGVYVCRACDLPLFTSAMKYDSGTGWPSFFASIPKHLATKTDNLLWVERTEYHCVRCGGHQGHVFDDGPAPTHERWCNNGLALRFIPRA